MSTASKVAEHKRLNPELYCLHCLWKTYGGPCPKHGGSIEVIKEQERQFFKKYDEEWTDKKRKEWLAKKYAEVVELKHEA